MTNKKACYTLFQNSAMPLNQEVRKAQLFYFHLDLFGISHIFCPTFKLLRISTQVAVPFPVWDLWVDTAFETTCRWELRKP